MPPVSLTTSILATGRVGSHLTGHRGMLKAITQAGRQGALIVDAGGYFGDTSYYRLGRGEVEQLILEQLYDVLLPAGLGFAHYLTNRALFAKSVCTNLTRPDGRSLFPPSVRVRISGIDTVVLGVIGRREFAAIPAAEREGVVWHRPAQVIETHARRAHGQGHTEVIVLGYCGAESFADIVRACRSRVGAFVAAEADPVPSTANLDGLTVVSVPADGVGCGRLQPVHVRGGWRVSIEQFPSNIRGRTSAPLQDLHSQIQTMTEILATGVAP